MVRGPATVRVHTKTETKAARVINEKHCTRWTTSTQTSAIPPSKKLYNSNAGRVTPLMKWVQRGPTRGSFLTLQEEERERRGHYITQVSAQDQGIIKVDQDTQEMLKLLDFGRLSNLQATQPTVGMNFKMPLYELQEDIKDIVKKAKSDERKTSPKWVSEKTKACS
ncbi:40S ribosomal protein S17-like [Echinops telfairi]|uniref:40S ribosomal protein S17-like n=1 Tax=Echinops telfairi TaxID=9371 RepID=A0AC55CM27_ECHTE|nr:40S ribosomal protein S17-like [Echinops telfairi]